MQCYVLESTKRVTVCIQGGSDGILTRSIFLCHELVSILSLKALKESDFNELREFSKGDVLELSGIKPIAKMQDCVQTAVEMGVSQLKNREVSKANKNVGLFALYLDPHYKLLDTNTCRNGGDEKELLCEAKAVLRIVGKAMDKELAKGALHLFHPSGNGFGASEPAPKCRRSLSEARQKEREGAAKSRDRRQSREPAGNVSARIEQEIVAYDHIPCVTANHIDVIDYYCRVSGEPILDKDGDRRGSKIPAGVCVGAHLLRYG